MEYKIFGEGGLSLKDLRKIRGFSQTEVAVAMGITAEEVAVIENDTDPTLGTIKRFVAALGGTVMVNIIADDWASSRNIDEFPSGDRLIP